MSCCNSNCNHDPCGSSFNQSLTRAAQYAQYAQTQANKAEDLWLEFNALYLGAFAVAPTQDNEGNPLQVGALYWNTGASELYAWNGLAWVTATGFNEFTPFLSTGSTAPRNLATRMADVVNVKDFGAVGDGVTDDTAAIQNAIDSLLGTFDVYANYSGNEYSGKPSQILFFPAGIYKTTSRLLVEKNNVCIRGSGWNSTIIKYGGSSIIKEVIRFRNSYCGELSDIGLDGGLPYNPTLSETYGANAGLCCDLTPFFTSRNLWIANTRLTGLCAIHLWESYFDNFQVRNSGWFTNESLSIKGAGIYFCADPTLKESSNALGGGFESQNTIFVKPKLVPVGCLTLCEAATQNITYVDVITENRDFATYFPALSYTKYSLNSLNNNFQIKGGYFYGHAHSFASNSCLFAINSNAPGISINNFYVYTAVPSGFPEVDKIFNVAGIHPVSFDGLIIDDVNTQLTNPFTIFDTPGYATTVIGDINYSSPTTVFASTLLGANSNSYKGTLSCTNTATSVVNRNTYFADARKYDTLTGAVQELFNSRAWISFNGVTGTISASGNVSSLTKTGTGVYGITFTNPMPDANYSTLVSANKLNSASEVTEIATQLQTAVSVANRAGATFYDPSIVNVSVFR